MRLLILGATGGTGLALIERSLLYGHSVTAFVRSADTLKEFNDRIEIVEGNLLDRNQLSGVLTNHDGVLSGFGPRVPIAKEDAHLLKKFATVLTDAMRDQQIRRIVIISTAFLFKDSIIPPPICWESSSFRRSLPIRLTWKESFEEVGWIGRLFGRRN